MGALKQPIMITLSICIPIYNFDVRPLVQALHAQLQDMQGAAELIMIDDASNMYYKSVNKAVAAMGTYVELPKNIGRAKIRNRFLDYAKGEYLLFLDGDALLMADDFLSRYSAIISQKKPQIICGGRVYPSLLPSAQQALRWRYGHAKESQTADVRAQHPNRSFMTNNFVVQRSLLQRIPFDERLSRYGHEDTLFGFELSKQGVAIVHIDNPILNGDIETNALFMAKTEAAIVNLAEILAWRNYDKALIDSMQLSKVYYAMPPWSRRLWAWVFRHLVKRPLRWSLLHWRLPLFCFDVYKLGYLSGQKATI